MNSITLAFKDLIDLMESLPESQHIPSDVAKQSVLFNDELHSIMERRQLSKKELYPALIDCLTLGQKQPPPIEGILLVSYIRYALPRLKSYVITEGLPR